MLSPGNFKTHAWLSKPTCVLHREEKEPRLTGSNPEQFLDKTSDTQF